MALLLRRTLAAILSASLAFSASAPAFAAAAESEPEGLAAATSLLLAQAADGTEPLKAITSLRDAATRAAGTTGDPARAEAARWVLTLIAHPERIQAERAVLDQRLGKENVSRIESLVAKLQKDARPGSALKNELSGLKHNFSADLDLGDLTANLDALYTGAGARSKGPAASVAAGDSGKSAGVKAAPQTAAASGKAKKMTPPAPRPEPPKAPGGWKRIFTHTSWLTATVGVALGVAVAAAAILGPWAPIDPSGQVIAAFVAAGVGTGVVSFFGMSALQSLRANSFWKKSPQAADISRIERGLKAGDAAALAQLGDGASRRYSETVRLIKEAEARGDGRIGNERRDAIDKAKTYALFDLLVMARARLGENAASTDAKRRMGENPPAGWRSRLANEEAAAIGARFEGTLALTLKDLWAELGRQKTSAGKLAEDLKRFRGEVPPVFAGPMGKQADAADRDLAGFQSSEIDAEGSLFRAKTDAMRGRVSDRLYSEGREYRDHYDRYRRLSATLADSAGPAAGLAREVDERLGRAIHHREQEAWNLVMAASQSAVPVTHTRIVNDSNGQTRTETYIEIEDHSAMYRSAAASEASDAQSEVRGANYAMGELRPALGRLHNDRTVDDEGLGSWLPMNTPGWINEGGGGFGSWFLPPLWQQFESMDSRADVERARGEFRAVLSALIRVEGEINSRRTAENGWVEDRITGDLQRQMDEARRKEPPPKVPSKST